MGENMMQETYQEEEYQPLALALGQVALAWNDSHGHFGFVFETLMAPRQDTGTAQIWHSLAQDRALRQMLKAAIIFKHPAIRQSFPTALDDVCWMINQAEALEDARNDIVHSPVMRLPGKQGEPVVVRPWNSGQYRATKLGKRPDLLLEFLWCRDTALTLRDYASSMDIALEALHSRMAR
jgi:hypothetical protein